MVDLSFWGCLRGTSGLCPVPPTRHRQSSPALHSSLPSLELVCSPKCKSGRTTPMRTMAPQTKTCPPFLASAPCPSASPPPGSVCSLHFPPSTHGPLSAWVLSQTQREAESNPFPDSWLNQSHQTTCPALPDSAKQPCCRSHEIICSL